MSVFQPVSFEAAKVGKLIKGSKMRYSWKILLDGLDYSVVLFYSKISTKVKILVNGEMTLNTKATEQQHYKFMIRYRSLDIVKIGDDFDLRHEKFSAKAILAGRQSVRCSSSIKPNSARVQLRRSLPCNLPPDLPVVNFKKKVRNVDLLEFESRNPFDFEEEEVKLSKTSSDINSVPWPKDIYSIQLKRKN